MRIATWSQDTFQTPNQQLYRSQGDFLSIDELLPSRDGRSLERAPSWEGHYDYPSDFEDVRGALWSHAGGAIYLIGSDTSGASNAVATFYVQVWDQAISAMYTNGGAENLDGLHKQNARWIFNGFWYIGQDGHVYRTAAPIVGSATDIYTPDSAADHAQAIIAARDTVWLLDDEDVIHEYDPATAAFSVFFDPDYETHVQHIAHFRNHFILFTLLNDGSLAILQVDDREPTAIHQLATFPAASGEYVPGYNVYGTYGTPWALLEDAIYFSPGAYTTIADAFEEVPIYRFNGSRVEHITTVEAPFAPDVWGLLSWRERLLLYFAESTDQRVYVLHGDEFTPFLTSTYTTPTRADIYSVGGYLVLPTQDTGVDGITITRRPASPASFTSSWLDMGHPGSQKRLSRLACMVTNAAASFNVKIEYRTEAGSWTTATEQANVRHVDIGNLGVDFYLLQIRITFTDSTGTYPDVKLESLSATYSYGVP